MRKGGEKGDDERSRFPASPTELAPEVAEGMFPLSDLCADITCQYIRIQYDHQRRCDYLLAFVGGEWVACESVERD